MHFNTVVVSVVVNDNPLVTCLAVDKYSSLGQDDAACPGGAAGGQRRPSEEGQYVLHSASRAVPPCRRATITVPADPGSGEHSRRP